MDPFANNLNGTTIIDGKKVPLMEAGGGTLHLGVTPIGPTWDPAHYFLGADSSGRDVMARMLYGGRSSLLIGIGSAVICCLIATIFALIAGFFGGTVDALLSRMMDLIWAFPVILLAICISTELLTSSNGLKFGPIHLVANSLWLPTLIIAVIYVPYVYRPIRGHVLTVVNKEYAEAAIAQGASNLRLMFSDILPNVVSVVIVLLPLMIATTIFTEAALSFLSIGVQPPNASWGTIISDGQRVAVHPADCGDRARDHDCADRAGAERAGRRYPRRAGSARQAEGGGAVTRPAEAGVPASRQRRVRRPSC